MTTTTYTVEAKELLGEFVQRAGKNFLVVKVSDVFGDPTTIKITPTNLGEFYATQANNLSSGRNSDPGRVAWRLATDQRVGEPRPRLVQDRERRGNAASGQTGRVDAEVLREAKAAG